MSSVRVDDKLFREFIPETEIKAHVKALAEQISKDMAGKNPLFLAVLNGSFIFAADLMRDVTVPSEITFVRMSSYEGTASTGQVREVLGINENVKGRTVIVVEDIIETGLTMKNLLEMLKALEPSEVHLCTLLLKPARLQTELNVEYTAFEIPNDFIVGYGLDYNGQGRNLKSIYVVDE